MRIEGIPREAEQDEVVAIDLEMFGQKAPRLHLPVGQFACLTFAFEDATYMITDVNDLSASLDRVDKALWTFHNAMYDLRQLRRFADIPPRKVWDTLLIEKDLFGGYYNGFSLADLTRRWLGEILPKDQRTNFGEATEMTESMKHYSFRDPEVTLACMKKQAEYISLHHEDMRHYWDIDMWAIWAILDMPSPRVDAEAWREASDNFKVEADEAEAELGINAKSWQQKQKWLAEVTDDPKWVKIKNPDTKKVIQKGRSTAQDVLESLVEDGYGEVKKLIHAIQMRDMSGARYGSGFVDKYMEPDGTILSDWKVVGAPTGRMASSDPNLQNIPYRNFPIFRSFFIAREGNVLSKSDVSQQEPRITAHYSKDSRLMADIQEGRDLHQSVADSLTELMGVPVDRFIGKTINLGSAYGLSEFGLAGRLDIEVDDARQFLDLYFRQYPGISRWINKIRSAALKLGYVRTVTGRRSWINPYDRKWKNNAINSPIQGSAADHTKLALVLNWRYSQERGLPFSVVLIVHDEIVMDYDSTLEEEYAKLDEDAWTDAWASLIDDVPVKIDRGIGPNWLDAGKEEEDDGTDVS